MRNPVVVLALALVGLAPRPAEACSPFTNAPFEIEPGLGGDVTPPGAVTADATFAAALDDAESMCAWAGVVSLRASATDDASAGLGFQVSVVQGTLIGAPAGPITHGLVNELVFYTTTIDVDVVLDVRAVDRAGNVGPATRVVAAHPVVADGGCAAGGGAGGGGAVALALALGLALRGRRRRRVIA